MGNLIDRDAAYDAIGFERCDRSCTDCPTKCTWFYTVKNIPAVNRWISVEDALPENNEIVWFCLYLEKDAYVRKGYIKNEVWYTADGYRMSIKPKFWMHEYIPEPPEKE